MRARKFRIVTTTVMFYKDERWHRDNSIFGFTMPAIVGSEIFSPRLKYKLDPDQDAIVVYFKNGMRHRRGGPARIMPTGRTEDWLYNEHIR